LKHQNLRADGKKSFRKIQQVVSDTIAVCIAASVYKNFSYGRISVMSPLLISCELPNS